MTPTLSELIERESLRLTLAPSLLRLPPCIGKPGFEAEPLIDLLSHDSALSAHVLGIINSAYYALPVKVDSVKHAISAIGLQSLQELVLALKVAESFSLFSGERSDSSRFWRNSLYAASVARDLYRALGHSRHNLFAITLLHHLGALVLQQRLPQQMKEVLRAVRGQGMGLPDAERSALGYTHAEVGAALLERCGLPAIFSEVTRHHHDFYRADRFATEAAVVHLADSLAQQHCPMRHYEGIDTEPDGNVFRYVTLPPQRLARLYQTVHARRCDTSLRLA